MQSLGFMFNSRNIYHNFLINLSQAYNNVRTSLIDAGQSVFNSDNVVMQQETTKALNDLENYVLSDHKTIENINATNS